jgi:UDP-3-O-acyl N-acetylglucosamine deacetylase
VEFSGIGLHTGAMVHMRLLPAEANAGINFVRSDTADTKKIPLSVSHVEQKPLCTTITANGVYVQTVEHLLSAISAFGIDNITIEINSIEPPGADGSAKEFCNLILDAGVHELDEARRRYVVEEPIYFSEGEGNIVALPNPEGGFRISYTLEFESNLIPTQHYMFDMTTENYINEISAARTFCLSGEAAALIKAGFGKGASSRNTCIIAESDHLDDDLRRLLESNRSELAQIELDPLKAGDIIDNELRYPDEHARHKILDLIGDLTTLGFDLNAHIVAIRSGHKHNFRLAHLIEKNMNHQLKACSS